MIVLALAATVAMAAVLAMKIASTPGETDGIAAAPASCWPGSPA